MLRLISLIVLMVVILHPAVAQEEIDEVHEVLRLGRGTANALAWRPDGEVLAVGGSLGVWLYDDSLADLAHFPDDEAVVWLAWSPEGDQLITIGGSDTVKLWDVTLNPDTLTLNRSWAFHDDSYSLRFALAPEGERIAVVTSDGAQVLDINTGESLLTIPDLKFTLTWHPDGTEIAGVVDLGEEIGEQMRVWDTTTGAVINTYTSEYPYLFWSDLQWSPDGSILVGVTSIPATLHAWDVETGELLSDVDPSAGEFVDYFDLWWLEDGQQLVTASRSISPPAYSAFALWNTDNWTAEDRGLLLGNVRSIEKRPNFDMWALLTWDGQMMTWGLEAAEPLQVRSVYSQPPQILVWSPDSQYLAGASSIGETINIWDMTIPDQPQLQIATKPYQSWNLDGLRWSANSDTLIGFQSIPGITAPGAFPIAFVVAWDPQTGEFLEVLHETPGYVAHDGSGDYLPYFTWSNDFTRVVTEMSDQPLTISTTGGESGLLSPNEEITTIDIVDDSTQITWSPDNTMLAVITRDPQGETSAWVYNAETGDRVNRLRSSFFTVLYGISWSPDSSMVALVGSRGIAGSGETEYRLDVLEVDPLSDEAAHIMTVLDTGTTFYHAWHPESRAIAVTTTSGVSIYSIASAPIGVDADPITTIANMRIFSLAWSLDGTWLAGGHEDGTIRIWDVSAFSAAR